MVEQYWRFPSEAVAVATLQKLKITSSGEASIGSLDWVGEIYYGGKYDFAAKRLSSPPLAYSGYHVNYLGPLISGMPAQYVVAPTNPSRRWYR